MKKTLLFLLSFVIVWSVAFYIGKQKSTSSVVTPYTVQKEEGVFDCPYRINGGIYKDYVRSQNEVRVVEKPRFIDNPQVSKLSEPFNVQEFEKDLYKLADDKGWQSRRFDVDGDGKDEMIINANVTMNHTPNIANIVKNGNVIFKAGGASIWIDEVYGGQGFLLKENIDWNTGEEKWTRYIFRDDGFMPVWTQKVCWVEFE